MTQAQLGRRAPTVHTLLSHFLRVYSAPSLRAPCLPLTLAVPVARPRQGAGPGHRENAGLSARRTAATAPWWGRGGAWRAGLGRAAGTGACGWAGRWAWRPLGASGESEPNSCRGRGLRMAGTAEGWPLRREAGVLLQGVGGNPLLLSSLFNTPIIPVRAPGPFFPRHG